LRSLVRRRCARGRCPASSCEGLLVPAGLSADPLVFQSECMEAFVASWAAQGFAASTIDNDIGVLERMLEALGRPAWEVTAEDVDRVVGDLARTGRATSTCPQLPAGVQGFHRFLEVCKAVEIEVAFGVRLACPVDEYNSSRQVSSDSLRHNNGVGVMQQAQRVSRRCAFFLASEDTPGLIVESGPTQQLFDAPADPRTADYVHGRFG